MSSVLKKADKLNLSLSLIGRALQDKPLVILASNLVGLFILWLSGMQSSVILCWIPAIYWADCL